MYYKHKKYCRILYRYQWTSELLLTYFRSVLQSQEVLQNCVQISVYPELLLNLFQEVYCKHKKYCRTLYRYQWTSELLLTYFRSVLQTQEVLQNSAKISLDLWTIIRLISGSVLQTQEVLQNSVQISVYRVYPELLLNLF